MKNTLLNLLFFSSLSVMEVNALPPVAPNTRLHIEVSQEKSEKTEREVQLQWDQVEFADGYNLLYADYPNFGDLQSVDLGNTFLLKTTLPVGTAFWVAIQAYNADGGSLVSEIHPVVITSNTPSLLPPQVTRSREGNQLTLRWEAVPNATGYKIRYGETPNLNSEAIIDIRDATSYTLPVVNGKFHFVGVSAYHDTETSPLALGLVTYRPRVVALVSREAERQGLQDGLKRFGKQWGDLQLDIIKWDTLETVTTQVRGKKAAEGKLGSVRGLLDDPEVLALVTTSTNSTLRALQDQRAHELLIVAMSAPSTVLKPEDNVIQMVASNHKQAETMHRFLDSQVQTTKQMNRYVVIVEEDIEGATQHFDLYLNLLRRAFDTETTVPLLPAVTPFSQLLATFSYDGAEETLQGLATSIAVLKPEIALYLGTAENFRNLSAKVSVPQWLGGGELDDLIHDTFTTNQVSFLTLGSPGEYGQTRYFSAYDTLGLLGQVFSNVKGVPTRPAILAAARKLDSTPYPGITGLKSFIETDETGWYDIFTFTEQEEWQRE